MNLTEISLVIPLLNEAGNINELLIRLKNTLNNLGRSWEIILVDDGSSDDTFQIIRQFAIEDPRIIGISLSRNFGQQIALIAGLNEACGNLIITLDADLQHPPELIPRLIEVQSEGFDIVNTKRIEHLGTGKFKKWSSAGFYAILNRLSDVKLEPGSADFRLFTRQALDAFLAFPEKDRFNRGLVVWMGFKQGIVSYVAPPRKQGQTNYTLKKMVRLGLDGIAAFSSKPLRISAYLGIVTTIIGLLYIFYALIAFLTGHTSPGWTSLIAVVVLLGGVQLLCLGIIGEYIARIYNESKNRPLFFIKDNTREHQK
ncbi:MAG: glycosyltransferase family 2 protein [Bacteroidia bacterium]|nr:glycosyltransferase family 2 protein [Bacteroidia bacterium]